MSKNNLEIYRPKYWTHCALQFRSSQLFKFSFKRTEPLIFLLLNLFGVRIF